jgi:DNA-binding response OmpR family regulator
MSQSNKVKILIVEDDLKLAGLLSEYLIGQGFEVVLESTGNRAVKRIAKENPTIVVLDLMLPGLDGFEVCKQARKHYTGGIMMLTARKTEIDQAVGLEIGADDYVLKPVEPRIFLARIKSLLRRVHFSYKQQPERDRFALGSFIIDRSTREVRIDETPISMTSFEFDLLWLLASRNGEVVTRDTLYLELRETPYDGLDRSIDIHVSRIRRKLKDSGLDPDFIRGVRGAGYLMVKG